MALTIPFPSIFPCSVFVIAARLPRTTLPQAPPLAMTMRAYSTSMKDSLKAYTFGNACGRQIQSHGLSNAQARMKTNVAASEMLLRAHLSTSPES